MTGGQRTFTHIPTSLVRSNGQQRPMTSKAAKKAYQQANRGPKVSRAEQYRRDKAELEQQKREYEREKAAERAKAAREKKAAKAAAEKEARKKQGIPEPSKFVRASQPTISRFVWSGSTSKRTWQQMESVAEDPDKTISDAEKDDGGPPAKRQAINQGSDDEFGDFPSLSQSDLLERIDTSIVSLRYGASAPGSARKRRLSLHPRYCKSSQEFPVMKDAVEHETLNTQALDEMTTIQLLSDLAEAVTKPGSRRRSNRHPSELREEIPDMTPKPPESPKRSGRVAGRAGNEAAPLRSQKRATVPVVEIPYKSLEEIQSQVLNSPVTGTPKLHAPVCEPVPRLAKESDKMLPPRLPTKLQVAVTSDCTPQKLSFPPRNPSSYVPKPLPNLPPTSTQAFLENHIDDFFPSPTQAVRELLEDVDDIPSNTQVARELSPKKAEANYVENMFCTQDMIMSPEDLVEIISPDRSLPKHLVKATSSSIDCRDVTEVSKALIPERRKESGFNGMFCSQDLIMPEDLPIAISSPRSPLKPPVEATVISLDRRDIANASKWRSSKGLGKGLDNMSCSQDLIMSPEDLPVAISSPLSPPKPLVEATSNALNRRRGTHILREAGPEEASNSAINDLFGTQDLILSPEDLKEICSPVREPFTAVEKRTSPNERANPAPRQAHRQRPRFFEEKEEDLYYAAIHESKTDSTRDISIPKRDPTSCGRNQSDSTDYGEFDFDLPALFEEKEDEELQAAIRESKITAELEAKRFAMAGMPGLSRTQSNSTDYGDFDPPRLFEEQEANVHNTRPRPETNEPKQVDVPNTNCEKPKPRRFFEEKYEDQVYAAIHESKMLAANKPPPRQNTTVSSEKPKRSLKRVLSTATDYGDDDFMGCSQELMDLC